MHNSFRCPLCSAEDLENITVKIVEWTFFKCLQCGLHFKSLSDRPSSSKEKIRYEEHNNDPEDQRYLNYLRKAADPLIEMLNEGDKGLDFGCGPGPASKKIFTNQSMDYYDPFFFEDRSLLEKKYNFLFCTEAVEHFYEPKKTWEQMFNLLHDDGILMVMTNILYEDIDFSSWWYIKDPTHVVLYTPESLNFIERTYTWKKVFEGKNLIAFKK
ncbi:MAG: methyltransferase domain-containing protein [Bdellovibrionales bacterium]